MFSLGFAVNITAELNGNMYDLIWDRLKKDVLEVNYHLNLWKDKWKQEREPYYYVTVTKSGTSIIAKT